MTEITIVLVDDDAIVRYWARASLVGSEFRLVGEASSSDEAMSLIDRRHPDLLLLDYRLPDRVGLEMVKDLRQRGITTPAVVMTANPEPGFNEAAREAGAQGSFLKTGDGDELVRVLRLAAGGEHAFDHRHPRRPPGHTALSSRERQVLGLVAGGATNKEIGDELGIGSETVKTLLTRIFTKLGAHRRSEAVTLARERGILP